MGYNTVALLLNDAMHDLAKSPKALTRLLTIPQMHNDKNRAYIRDAVEYGQEHGEDPRCFYGGGIQVLPTFHADNLHFLVAGHNTLAVLEMVRFGRTKDGIRTVTLTIPEWAAPQRRK